MREYPQEERRQDLKIDDIWKSMPGMKADILDIRQTTKRHDRLLYGWVDDNGIQQAGISTMVVWLQKNFARTASIIIGLLVLIVFVPAEWREFIFKSLFGLLFK